MYLVASIFMPLGLLDPLFKLGYNILKGIAILLWALDRLLLAVGYFIAKFTEILIDRVFSPGLQNLGHNLQVNLLPLVFTIAVILLGLTYVLAAFWFKDLNLVDWKKAIAWLLGALLFYTAGADLFRQGEVLRRDLGGLMYETILNTKAQNCSNNPGAGNTVPLPSLSELLPSGVTWASDDSGLGPLCNVFQGDLQYDTAIDGLDIAFSYVFGVKGDLNRSLPDGLSDRYFVGYDSGFFADNNWSNIYDKEIKGLHRLFLDIWIIVFGIVEQFVFFVLTVVAATMFFTLAFALLLSFFTRTEYLARSVIRAWFSVLTVGLFASFIQATGVFILLVAATSLNPIITQAGTIMGLALVFISAKMAIESAIQLMSSLPVMGQGISMAVGAGSSIASTGMSAAMLFATRGAGGAGRAGMMGGGGMGGGGMMGNGQPRTPATAGMTMGGYNAYNVNKQSASPTTWPSTLGSKPQPSPVSAAFPPTSTQAAIEAQKQANQTHMSATTSMPTEQLPGRSSQMPDITAPATKQTTRSLPSVPATQGGQAATKPPPSPFTGSGNQ